MPARALLKRAPSDANGAADVKAKASDTKASDTKASEATKTPNTTASETSAPKAAASATTGQGSAAGAAKLSTEQRTKISTVIKQQKVERVDAAKLNISINVGTRIPERGVRFHPLPQEVFVIYPEWRGYDYIMVGDQIVVVDPRSHEIVAILEA